MEEEEGIALGTFVYLLQCKKKKRIHGKSRYRDMSITRQIANQSLPDPSNRGQFG